MTIRQTSGAATEPARAGATTHSPSSLVMHSAVRYYDLLAAFLTLGRERALRERIATIARVSPGETVLDVGCGTGSLAVVVKRRVGTTGSVRGIDASPEMIERARAKAASARVRVAFDVGRADSLPLPDASVNVVLGTLMMHHLPPLARERFAAEIRRVLRPGGRVLIVDFEAPSRRRGGLIARFHRHGGVPLTHIVEILGSAGMRVLEIGEVGVAGLQFALACAPAAGETAGGTAGEMAGESPPMRHVFDSLPVSRVLLTAAIVAALAVHMLLLRTVRPALVLGTLGAGAAFAATHLIAARAIRTRR